MNEGRTIASLSAEYGFAKSTYQEWEKKDCEECQENEESKEELNLMEQTRMLKKQLAEQQKEIEFLIKAAAFFAKEIKSFIRPSMILRTSGTTRTARIHTTITKHLMKFALQHINRLQVLQFWLTKVGTLGRHYYP